MQLHEVSNNLTYSFELKTPKAGQETIASTRNAPNSLNQYAFYKFDLRLRFCKTCINCNNFQYISLLSTTSQNFTADTWIMFASQNLTTSLSKNYLDCATLGRKHIYYIKINTARPQNYIQLHTQIISQFMNLNSLLFHSSGGYRGAYVAKTVDQLHTDYRQASAFLHFHRQVNMH